MKQCVVLDENLRLVFEGSSDEVKKWLHERPNRDRYYVYTPEYDRLVTVEEFLQIYTD